MLNKCLNCKKYSVDKQITDDGNYAICPFCGYKQRIIRMPLFSITGASGIGKSTICTQLFLKEKDYIVIESDILWNDVYNTPENNYKEYRELQLRLCKNISQIGKPVVLCGCTTPKQFEKSAERRYFTDIHYLAIVANDEVLIEHLTQGRNIKDEDWIKSSVNFNRWLKDNADKTTPKIKLLDISDISIEKAAGIIDEWIYKIIGIDPNKR